MVAILHLEIENGACDNVRRRRHVIDAPSMVQYVGAFRSYICRSRIPTTKNHCKSIHSRDLVSTFPRKTGEKENILPERKVMGLLRMLLRCYLQHPQLHQVLKK